ncbi:MAG: cytochrome c, partial [Syntrophales bacterium LBB04]|nr:cytochrome c [Syntrophales bacterium LBB04]
SKTPRSHLSAAGLAAQMWNHAPGMWEKMSAKSIEFKKINETQMADLFAFFYVMRYMDELGDPVRGREVLEKKRCADCHGIGEKKGKVSPDLSLWAGFTNPILWIQMMWNHALKMKKDMDTVSIPWPKLSGNDLADIIAYVRSLNPSEEKVFLAPGDPAEGKRLFSQKRCGWCHAIRGKGGTKGPDLGAQKSDFPLTLSRLAGLMWDHFPDMFKEMEKQNLKVPELTAKDIANITAYLFSIRYFDPAGNAAAGMRLFEDKRCHACHDIGGEAKSKKGGPDLAKLKGMVSPIYMATALWNHGPKMIGEMKERNIRWQKITDKELIDLMEYLNRGD